MIDISILIAVIGVVLSIATFYFGRQAGAKQDGKSAGALETDISYIKESVQRIETQLNRDVQRLEGRIDEISNQMSIISNTAGRAHESAKSAHNRIDEHLQREHNITVERGRTPRLLLSYCLSSSCLRLETLPPWRTLCRGYSQSCLQLPAFTFGKQRPRTRSNSTL